MARLEPSWLRYGNRLTIPGQSLKPLLETEIERLRELEECYLERELVCHCASLPWVNMPILSAQLRFILAGGKVKPHG